MLEIQAKPSWAISNLYFLFPDVANIEFGPVSEKTLFKAQTRDQINLKTVGIGIYAKSGASTVELSDDIKKRIVEVKKTLPEGLDLRVSFNRATYVQAAINDLKNYNLIGFDTETKPTFVKGPLNPPSIMQLACDDKVYIFQFDNDEIFKQLSTILSNKNITK